MKCGKNIRGALSYNEKKLNAGMADLLLASGFGCDVSELGFSAKLARFQRNIEDCSHPRKTNTVHISLNFAKEDMVSDDAMRLIALDYMQQIGFGEQPFLVYKHKDASHQHFHIVTTNIQEKGESIDVHNLVQRESEAARKAIELEYGLVQASSRNSNRQLPVIAADTATGKECVKNFISNMVREVVSKYRFADLKELNAVLRQFDVVAETHDIKGKRPCTGLIYSKVDQYGNRISRGIAASAIYSQPTYKKLQYRFCVNQIQKVQRIPAVTNHVQGVLDRCSDPGAFKKMLLEKGIGITVIRGGDGVLKDILFVSHVSKTVHAAAELGLTPDGIMARIQANCRNAAMQTQTAPEAVQRQERGQTGQLWLQLAESVFLPQQFSSGVDPAFRKKKKRKRKRPS